MNMDASHLVPDVTGILLAGGKSRRMGEDKRHLSVGDRTLLERSLSALRAVFHRVIIVIAQDSPALTADVPVLRDLIPHCGSLGGLYTGLKRAETDYVFVVACDMPFLHSGTIRWFTQLKGDWDIVMAKLQNGLHPMHALYGRRCLPVIEDMIRMGDLKIQGMATHPSLRVRILTQDDLREIDTEAQGFLNVNTPADLEAARLLAKGRPDSAAS